MDDDRPKLFRETLQLGDEGEDVRMLQLFLLFAGSNPNVFPSGEFGEETRKGVRAFQVVLGISATGKFDTATKKKLKELHGLDVDQILSGTLGRP